MTDTVVAALITVAGTVTVAVVSVVTQLRVTKAVIRSEHQRILAQVRAEEERRARENRREHIRSAITDLLGIVDPQINARIDYSAVVRIIHRVQLLLDRRKPDEAELNGALNKIGLTVQSYVLVQSQPLHARTAELSAVLEAQSAVLDRAQVLLALPADDVPNNRLR